MTMTVGKTFTFEAAHSLPHLGADHKCSRPHGHSYKLLVEVTGTVDPGKGWVRDYADLSDVVNAKVVDVLDHRDVNAFVTPSTAENLALWVWRQLAPHLPDLSTVEVYETPTTVVRLNEWDAPGES